VALGVIYWNNEREKCLRFRRRFFLVTTLVPDYQGTLSIRNCYTVYFTCMGLGILHNEARTNYTFDSTRTQLVDGLYLVTIKLGFIVIQSVSHEGKI
jgi:hypothetical protein